MAVARPRQSLGSSITKVNGTPTKTGKKASTAPNGASSSSKAANQDETNEASTSSASSTKAGKGEYFESLSRHNAAFTALLHLIPPQFYLSRDVEDELAEQEFSSKYMKNKRKKAKSEIEAKERKEKIREAKKQRLDPDNFKTITDIQQERAAAKAARRAAEKDSDVDVDADGMVSEGDEEDDGDVIDQDEDDQVGRPPVNGLAAGDTDEDMEDSDTEDLPVHARNIKSLEGVAKPIQTEGERKASIDALRAKLHAKIAGLQRQRGLPVEGGDDGSEDASSVISSKDELLEERRRKRQEVRDRKKQQKKDAKASAKAAKSDKKAGANGATANGKSLNVATKAPALLVAEPGYGPKGQTSSTSSALDIDTKGGSLSFSAIDFNPVGAAATTLPNAKKNRLALPSDPKAALQVLEHRRQAEEARKAKLADKLGDDARELSAKMSELEENKQWDKVIASASGVKIRDDEKLLKKAAKRKDKQKEKSSKAWNERQQNEQQKEADKQKRRMDNIAARKASKGNKGNKKGSSSTLSASKTHKAKNKSFGKARPGFEGKKVIGRGKK